MDGGVLLNDLIFIKSQKFPLAGLFQLLAQVILSHIEQIKEMSFTVFELFPFDDNLPEIHIGKEHFYDYISLFFI